MIFIYYCHSSRDSEMCVSKHLHPWSHFRAPKQTLKNFICLKFVNLEQGELRLMWASLRQYKGQHAPQQLHFQTFTRPTEDVSPPPHSPAAAPLLNRRQVTRQVSLSRPFTVAPEKTIFNFIDIYTGRS